MALTQPARLSKALDMLDTSKDGEMDMDEWMAAIKRGLAKRLDELADERERRERRGGGRRRGVQRRVPEHGPQGPFPVSNCVALVFRPADLNVTLHTQVFDMIDADGGGTLSKAEIVDAVKNNDEVIKFLSNCGNENLQSLLVPSRLEHALNCLDTDSDGEITAPEWCASESETLVCLATRRWRAGGVELRRRRGRKRVEALRGSPVDHNAGKRRSSRRSGPRSSSAARPARPRPPRTGASSRPSRSSSSTPPGRSSRSSTRTATAA